MPQIVLFVVLACDISGRPCREYEHPFVDLSVITCQMVSTQLLAQVMSAHPQKYAKRWQCVQAAGRPGRA